MAVYHTLRGYGVVDRAPSFRVGSGRSLPFVYVQMSIGHRMPYYPRIVNRELSVLGLVVSDSAAVWRSITLRLSYEGR